MEEDMRVIMSMIKKKVMGYFIGLMEENMKVVGKTASNMGLVLILVQVEKQRMENGKTEKGFTGFKINEIDF
jgi:hypothetical protein